MGFFLQDLHKKIADLHAQQFAGYAHPNSFTVYRGQGLLQRHFDQMVKIKCRLLSFNNFLSTSLDREVSLAFARNNQNDSDLIGVLFEITINPSTSNIPFANVHDVSSFKDAEEILFSMHSVFRIGLMKQVGGSNRLCQVDSTLAHGNDVELLGLTEQMRKEIGPDAEGWDRLGVLLIKLEQFDKVQEMYDILLDQTIIDEKKRYIYHTLGLLMVNQSEYIETIRYYKQSIEIKQKILAPTDVALAFSYNNISSVYEHLGDYSNALSYYQKALRIFQKNFPLNHPHLANCYGNIGSVYENMGDYSSALSFFEHALSILQCSVPENHSNLLDVRKKVEYLKKKL
ncbi:unnamed protein product [Rotaria sp. Silwood2]|nr:unnamed protein product [Rotaria sp. Silwood2]CAF4020168.1 unnamed protein product [Rotaria sp. Silwood2]